MLNKRWKYLAVVVSLVVVSVCNAQQLPIFTQYKLNGQVLNPAIAGAYGFTTLNLTSREQWAGFKGAPSTYTLSTEWRLLKRKNSVSSSLFGLRKLQKSRQGRVGFGGVLYSDNNGQVRNTGAKFAYSYHIDLPTTQLSLGVALNAFQIRFDKENLTFPEDGVTEEPLLSGDFKESMFAPDASIGAFILGRRYYFGISANQLFQSTIKIGGSLNHYRLTRHYFINSGYKFYIGQDYDIEPSFLIKTTEADVKGFLNKLKGMQHQEDLSVRVYYRDDYWGGVAYRTNGDLLILTGMRYQQFYFEYSFDYALTSIRNYSYGSHELSLGIRFGAADGRFRWKDRF